MGGDARWVAGKVECAPDQPPPFLRSAKPVHVAPLVDSLDRRELIGKDPEVRSRPPVAPNHGAMVLFVPAASYDIALIVYSGNVRAPAARGRLRARLIEETTKVASDTVLPEIWARLLELSVETLSDHLTAFVHAAGIRIRVRSIQRRQLGAQAILPQHGDDPVGVPHERGNSSVIRYRFDAGFVFGCNATCL